MHSFIFYSSHMLHYPVFPTAFTSHCVYYIKNIRNKSIANHWWCNVQTALEGRTGMNYKFFVGGGVQ